MNPQPCQLHILQLTQTQTQFRYNHGPPRFEIKLLKRLILLC